MYQFAISSYLSYMAQILNLYNLIILCITEMFLHVKMEMKYKVNC